MNKLIAISIVISGLVSCNSSKQEEATTNSKKVNLLDTAKWFIGTWQNQTPDGLFTEQWNQKNDSVYSAISTVVVNQKDTVFFEPILLEQKNNELFYTVSVKDQNKEEPVSFKLGNATGNQLVFENPKHDFPTKITYLKISEDSIVAFISGLIDGKEKIEQFPMKKIK